MKTPAINPRFSATIALCVSLLLPAAGALAGAVVSDGLEPVEIKRLDEVRAKPNVQWQAYTHVQLAPLDMSEAVIKAPSRTDKRDIKPLTEKQVQEFNEIYQKAFTRELIEDGAFTTGEGEQKSLLIRAKVLELAPTHIPDRRTNASGFNKVYTETAGKITMAFDILDASTGELLAQVVDQREGNRMWRENNEIHNRSQVRQMMGSWARIFRNHMDHLAGQ